MTHCFRVFIGKTIRAWAIRSSNETNGHDDKKEKELSVLSSEEVYELMKYGIEVSKGQAMVYQFTTEVERAKWLVRGEGRSTISGTSREVKRALYHGEVVDIGEREKEISTP